jgi:hypothetical protein
VRTRKPVVVTGLLVLALAGAAMHRSTARGVSLPFDGADGRVVVNEYSHWHPGDPTGVRSRVWDMTSGSLLRRHGMGWTGPPDVVAPNAESTNGTNSAVFRLTSTKRDFGNVDVAFRLFNVGLSSTVSTPPVDWDGVHVFLRYQTEFSLYYASINRRDGMVTIKKKVPGGPSNDGTYFQLAALQPHAVPYGTWQDVRARVQDLSDGSVGIQLYADNQLLVSAVDGGVGGPPLRGAGAVGIRGDNDEFLVRNFRVTPIV